MIVLTFDSDQLHKVIQNAVKAVLTEIPPNSPTPAASGPELLNRHEAADLAGVCVATIDNKVRDGVLRKYRTGGVVRFKRQEVIEAFSKSLLNKQPRRNFRHDRAKL